MTAPRTIELHRYTYSGDRKWSECVPGGCNGAYYEHTTATLKEEPMPMESRQHRYTYANGTWSSWLDCIGPDCCYDKAPRGDSKYEHRRVIVLPPVEEPKDFHVLLSADTGRFVCARLGVGEGCKHPGGLMTQSNALRLAAALNECVERHKDNVR